MKINRNSSVPLKGGGFLAMGDVKGEDCILVKTSEGGDPDKIYPITKTESQLEYTANSIADSRSHQISNRLSLLASYLT